MCSTRSIRGYHEMSSNSPRALKYSISSYIVQNHARLIHRMLPSCLPSIFTISGSLLLARTSNIPLFITILVLFRRSSPSSNDITRIPGISSHTCTTTSAITPHTKPQPSPPQSGKAHRITKNSPVPSPPGVLHCPSCPPGFPTKLILTPQTPSPSPSPNLPTSTPIAVKTSKH